MGFRNKSKVFLKFPISVENQNIQFHLNKKRKKSISRRKIRKSEVCPAFGDVREMSKFDIRRY